MSARTESPTAPRTALAWWVVGAGIVAVLAPLPDGWNPALQVATVIFGVAAVCIARGRAARWIAAAVVIVVGVLVCVQIVAQVAVLLADRTFVDDAVVIR